MKYFIWILVISVYACGGAGSEQNGNTSLGSGEFVRPTPCEDVSFLGNFRNIASWAGNTSIEFRADCSGGDNYCGYDFSYTLDGDELVIHVRQNPIPNLGCYEPGFYTCTVTHNEPDLKILCPSGEGINGNEDALCAPGNPNYPDHCNSDGAENFERS